MRHLEIRDLWLQKEVADGKLIVEKILGTLNPADLMTKVLTIREIEDRLGYMNMFLKRENDLVDGTSKSRVDNQKDLDLENQVSYVAAISVHSAFLVSPVLPEVRSPGSFEGSFGYLSRFSTGTLCGSTMAGGGFTTAGAMDRPLGEFEVKVIGGIRMTGRGGSRAFVPATREDEDRGFPMSGRFYVGGRITKPGSFLEWFQLDSYHDAVNYALSEAVRCTGKSPKEGDWWCTNCGYTCNFENNAVCFTCEDPRGRGLIYSWGMIDGYRIPRPLATPGSLGDEDANWKGGGDLKGGKGKGYGKDNVVKGGSKGASSGGGGAFECKGVDVGS